jgi:hypothetical protein
MNSTLTTERRHEHQQQTALPPLRRLSLADRAALHVGIALIRWSRRPAATAPRYRRTVSPADRARIVRDAERARTRSRTEHDLLMSTRLR